MMSKTYQNQDQGQAREPEIEQLNEKSSKTVQQRNVQQDWKGMILIVILFALVGYLIIENRSLHRQIQNIGVQVSNSTENYYELRQQVFEMDLNLFKTANHQRDTAQSTKLQLRNLKEGEEHERAFIQQQLIRCIRELIKIKVGKTESKEIPKILWLYTEHSLEGEKMVQQFLGKHTLKMARENNLTIHILNSWNAYEFLSKEATRKITNTMQNTKIQANVNDLLRLALLMEHGGIMINVSELFLVENFDWVYNTPSKMHYQVIIFSETKSWEEVPVYQDYFIAAVKQAQLIIDAFNILCWTISSGQLQFKELRQAAVIKEEMNSTVVRNILRNTLISCIESMTPGFYSVKVITLYIAQRLSSTCENSLFHLMKSSKTEFSRVCGKARYFLRFYNREKLQQEIQNSLDASEEITNAIPANSYWHQMLDLQKNKLYFKPLPPRPVHFCLIDATSDNDLTNVKTSIEMIRAQTFLNWTAVYFISKPSKDLTQYIKSQKRENIKFSLSSGSIGQDYEKGIINICDKKSFIMVLNKKETLNSKDFLKNLASKLAPHGVLGAFLSVNISGDVKIPSTAYENYSKKEFLWEKSSLEDIEKIVNHFRVFHSDCYKILPQFQLRNPEGTYYNNRFSFLEHFLFMVQNLTNLHDDTEIPHRQKVKWFVKSNSHIFSVPNQILVQSDFVIETPIWETIDKEELKMTSFKSPSYAMTYNMDHLVQNGQTMFDFAVFNPAHYYQSFSERKQKAKIPKIIHQIWIDGQMPETKKKVLQLNKKLYPDFEFKLWTKNNITRQRFPRSYDLLWTIYQADKTLRYSKKATMADVMRTELLYNEGGFYMDTSMILFNNFFYKWLSYKLVISTERTFKHRWAQSMGFFGVMPKFPGLLRVIQPNNTNRYNIYLRDALEIAGSNNFRHLVQRDDEYNKDYLLLPYDSFYPLTYALPNPFETYCLIQPRYLKQKQTIIFHFKDRVLIQNCQKYYPFSYGKEINIIGSSWQTPKW